MRVFGLVHTIFARAIVALVALISATPLLADERCPTELPPGVSCKVVPCSSYKLPRLEGAFTCFEARYSKPPPGSKLIIRYRYNGPDDWVIEYSEFNSDGELVPGLLQTLQNGKFCFRWRNNKEICTPWPAVTSSPSTSQASSWDQ